MISPTFSTAVADDMRFYQVLMNRHMVDYVGH